LYRLAIGVKIGFLQLLATEGHWIAKILTFISLARVALMRRVVLAPSFYSVWMVQPVRLLAIARTDTGARLGGCGISLVACYRSRNSQKGEFCAIGTVAVSN
jgi:hypothetical protein